MAAGGYDVGDLDDVFNQYSADGDENTPEDAPAAIAAFTTHDRCAAPHYVVVERLRALNRGDAVPAPFACPPLVPDSVEVGGLGGETPFPREDRRDPTHQWETPGGEVSQLAGADPYALNGTPTSDLLVEGQPAVVLAPGPDTGGRFVVYVQLDGCSYTTWWPADWTQDQVLDAAGSMSRN